MLRILVATGAMLIVSAAPAVTQMQAGQDTSGTGLEHDRTRTNGNGTGHEWDRTRAGQDTSGTGHERDTGLERDRTRAGKDSSGKDSNLVLNVDRASARGQVEVEGSQSPARGEAGGGQGSVTRRRASVGVGRATYMARGITLARWGARCCGDASGAGGPQGLAAASSAKHTAQHRQAAH